MDKGITMRNELFEELKASITPSHFSSIPKLGHTPYPLSRGDFCESGARADKKSDVRYNLKLLIEALTYIVHWRIFLE